MRFAVTPISGVTPKKMTQTCGVKNEWFLENSQQAAVKIILETPSTII
jgi:hypothetical protein